MCDCALPQVAPSLTLISTIVLSSFRDMSKTLPTDFMVINPTVKAMSDGQFCILFEGGMFPSLFGMLFGLKLTPETTQEEAEALAGQLAKHCPQLFVAFLNRQGLTKEGRLALGRVYNGAGLLDPIEEEPADCSFGSP
jgi:hypothetical protein